MLVSDNEPARCLNARAGEFASDFADFDADAPVTAAIAAAAAAAEVADVEKSWSAAEKESGTSLHPDSDGVGMKYPTGL